MDNDPRANLITSSGVTPRQAEFFLYLFDQTARNGYQPTYRDIAQKFGLRSVTAITCHFKALQKKGWLQLPPVKGESRSILFKRRPDGCPFRGFTPIVTEE